MKLELNVNRFSNEDVIATSTLETFSVSSSSSKYWITSNGTELNAGDFIDVTVGSWNVKLKVLASGNDLYLVRDDGIAIQSQYAYAAAGEFKTTDEPTDGAGNNNPQTWSK